MEARSWTRGIVAFAIVVGVIACVTLVVIRRAKGHKPSAVVVSQQPVAPPATQPARQPELPQTQPSANVPTDDPSMLALVAESEVSELRDGFTLAQWLELHGKDEGWKRTPDKKLEMTDTPRRECLSYVKKETLPSGADMVRALYFYPPPVPSPATLLALSGEELIKTCVLAVVHVEAHTPYSDFGPALRATESGHVLDLAVRQRFTARYGESVGKKDVPFWGTGAYRSKDVDVARWIPAAEIVSGFGGEGFFMPHGDALLSPPLVFVYARLPLVQEFEQHIPRGHRDPAMEAAQFHRSVAAAGVDFALSQRMEKLYEMDTTLALRLEEQADEICKTRCVPEAMPKPAGNDWKDPLVPLLQDWFKAVKSADAGHRAAGLLAADRLLMAFGSVRPWDQFGNVKSSAPEQSKRRSQLQALGATFEPGFSDVFYHYTGNWLTGAKDLDRDSEGGRLALLTWMSSGRVCDQGPEAFRQIISDGEGLLAKKIDLPTAAQVHFMVGDAYSDIVAIAAGESGGNGEYDPSQYEGEAESDGAKALQNYRAGLEVDNRSESAKDAWRQAWHLAAGLLPSQRYVCFGD